MRVYVHILILAMIAMLFSAAFLWLSRRLGPQWPGEAKERSYECGLPVEGKLMGRFSVKFYLVVILFLLFDLEVVFLFPWAIQQHAIGVSWWVWLMEGLVFSGILLAGWVYIIRQGVLEWSRSSRTVQPQGETR